MDFFLSVLLGLVQGVFEWLPISSEGQLAAVLLFFGYPAEQAVNYAVFLHIGTIVSALVYFRNDIAKLFLPEQKELLKFLSVAFFATAITGIPSYIFLRSILGLNNILLLLIGIALIATGFVQLKKTGFAKKEFSLVNAIFLGLGQGFSIIPGISRSGMTASFLLVRGFDAEEAFRISFLLGIPSIAAAEIFFGLKEGFVFDAYSVVALAVSALIGFVALHIILKAVKKLDFSVICFGLGFIYLAVALI